MTVQFEMPTLRDTTKTGAGVVDSGPFVARVRPGFYEKYGKRMLDCILVLIAAPTVIPVVAILALCIALSGNKPFYRQTRVGRGGRHFKIVKLRSMVANAEDVLESYLRENPEAKAEWSLKQKLCNDPRITRFGRMLRKTSLDELPQLWNVLKGDMSLVGPRPMMPSQKEIYPGKYYERMRPGITGPWQVSDRNETSFADRASYDARYYHSLSLKEDVVLLSRTVGAVLRCTGH